MKNYSHENKYHKFVGFFKINGETKPVYFDKKIKQYKTLITLTSKVKDKNTGEKREIYNTVKWEFLSIEDIKPLS